MKLKNLPRNHIVLLAGGLIAVTGQLCMTILIAMRVGKFLARSEGK